MAVLDGSNRPQPRGVAPAAFCLPLPLVLIHPRPYQHTSAGAAPGWERTLALACDGVTLMTSESEAVALGYDKARGEAALAAVRSAADALPIGAVQRLTTGLMHSGLRAIGVARRVERDAALAARFASLPAAELDQAHLAGLRDLGWAAVHLHMLGLQEDAVASGASVPVATITEALATRARMMAAADYHLGDMPGPGAEIASIRSGTGHGDLAIDLHRLAALYDDPVWKPILETDTKHYKATDAADARRLGDRILEALAGARIAGMPADLPERVFTLLRASYDEVHAAAQWLLRREPAALRSFPALHAMGGSGRPKAATEVPDEPSEPSQPAVA